MVTLSMKKVDRGDHLPYEVCSVYEVEGKIYAILVSKLEPIELSQLQENEIILVREVIINMFSQEWYVSSVEDSIAAGIKKTFLNNWSHYYFYVNEIAHLNLQSYQTSEETPDNASEQVNLKYKKDLLFGETKVETCGIFLDEDSFESKKAEIINDVYPDTGYILSWELVEWFYTVVAVSKEGINQIKAKLNFSGSISVRLQELENLKEYMKGIAPLKYYIGDFLEDDSVADRLIIIFEKAISDCPDSESRMNYIEAVKRIIDVVLSIINSGYNSEMYHENRCRALMLILDLIRSSSLEKIYLVKNFLDNPSRDNLAKMLNCTKEQLKEKLIELLSKAILSSGGYVACDDEESTLFVGEFQKNNFADIDEFELFGEFVYYVLDFSVNYKQINIKDASKKILPKAIATDHIGLNILADKNDYKTMSELFGGQPANPTRITLKRRYNIYRYRL